MKKKDAMKWVDALRSGEYQQTQGFLRDQNGFCCLGVLCDLYKNKINGDWIENSEEWYDFVTLGFKKESSALPSEITNYLNLKTDEGNFTLPSAKSKTFQKGLQLISVKYIPTDGSLMSLNDDGWTFKQIADFIEIFYKYIS